MIEIQISNQWLEICKDSQERQLYILATKEFA